jgi:hypothetical protein
LLSATPYDDVASVTVTTNCGQLPEPRVPIGAVTVTIVVSLMLARERPGYPVASRPAVLRATGGSDEFTVVLPPLQRPVLACGAGNTLGMNLSGRINGEL